jgi:hypothetical protein
MQNEAHPTTITCTNANCHTTLRRTGSKTHEGWVYACFCGSTTRIVPVKVRVSAKRSTGWNKPDTAA